MTARSNRKNFGLDPKFKKETEAKYGEVLDLSDMPDQMKMSAKLIDLAEPFHEGELDIPHLYDCVTIAWNECLLEDHGVKTAYTLGHMLFHYGNYRWLIDLLKERKRQMFPDDPSGVKKVIIVDKGNGDISINVLSDMDHKLMIKTAAKRLESLINRPQNGE